MSKIISKGEKLNPICQEGCIIIYRKIISNNSKIHIFFHFLFYTDFYFFIFIFSIIVALQCSVNFLLYIKYTYMHTFFFLILSCYIKSDYIYSSQCYVERSYGLSIPKAMVCIYKPQIPSLSPLATTSLFSMSMIFFSVERFIYAGC